MILDLSLAIHEIFYTKFNVKLVVIFGLSVNSFDLSKIISD